MMLMLASDDENNSIANNADGLMVSVLSIWCLESSLVISQFQETYLMAEDKCNKHGADMVLNVFCCTGGKQMRLQLEVCGLASETNSSYE
jgi:hypothetical protein